MSKSPEELKAIGFQLADEIETSIQPLLERGVSRRNAINLTVALLSKRFVIVKA